MRLEDLNNTIVYTTCMICGNWNKYVKNQYGRCKYCEAKQVVVYCYQCKSVWKETEEGIEFIECPCGNTIYIEDL